MAVGDWMKLIPTHDLYFNVGRVRVVKALPIEAMNTNASDWAVKSGKFSMGGGEAGPSVEDLMKSWKVNDTREKRHFSLWTLIKRTFWSLMTFLIIFVIIQVGWKCFEVWQLGKRLRKYGTRIRELYQEKERLMDQMRDNLAYIKRVSNSVLGRKSAAETDETTAAPEELVQMSGLPDEDNLM